MIPIVVLSLVVLLIAVRQIGNVRLPIWAIMSAGAAAVLLTGRIAPSEAWRAVDRDVMLFLFGVFVIGKALEDSGYLSRLSYRVFQGARTADSLVLVILLGSGFASAFLMNDTLAIIGTPVVLLLSRAHGIDPRPLLLSLAFGVTLGSVMSPIGNPQNLLIALHADIDDPFITFLRFLFVPTAINLMIAHAFLKWRFRAHFSGEALTHVEPEISDVRLANLSRASLVLFGLLVLGKIVLGFAAPERSFGLVSIAMVSALPILVLSSRRIQILREIDWKTLIFFGSMFVLMRSVWNTGLFQSFQARHAFDWASIPVVLSGSVLLSQVMSNVPLVALALPVLVESGASAPALMALAAGSTVAGNLFILGAASNVIIIESAERRTGATLTFWDFARAGVPLTLVNLAVYWIFLEWF